MSSELCVRAGETEMMHYLVGRRGKHVNRQPRINSDTSLNPHLARNQLHFIQ